jgi:hypothetical protein
MVSGDYRFVRAKQIINKNGRLMFDPQLLGPAFHIKIRFFAISPGKIFDMSKSLSCAMVVNYPCGMILAFFSAQLITMSHYWFIFLPLLAAILYRKANSNDDTEPMEENGDQG